jgi:hypothetical protein
MFGASSAAAPAHSDRRSVEILARSIFRELKSNGYGVRQILSLSSELIGLVTAEYQQQE